MLLKLKLYILLLYLIYNIYLAYKHDVIIILIRQHLE